MDEGSNLFTKPLQSVMLTNGKPPDNLSLEVKREVVSLWRWDLRDQGELQMEDVYDQVQRLLGFPLVHWPSDAERDRILSDKVVRAAYTIYEAQFSDIPQDRETAELLIKTLYECYPTMSKHPKPEEKDVIVRIERILGVVEVPPPICWSERIYEVLNRGGETLYRQLLLSGTQYVSAPLLYLYIRG
jgi:hypothetical protein